MKILDCTLRDGGYYTDWHFDKKLVENYLNAIDSSGIDVVEVGLRIPQKNKFFGPFAYSNDLFLETLNLPKNCEIAVMINARDYIKNDKSNTSLLNTQFNLKENSPVDLVRIAAHYSEINALPSIVNDLSNKGYKVAINLMQTGSKTPEVITKAVKQLSHLELEALYFADSFGDMNYSKILSTIKAMKEGWGGNLGIHAHNNMGMAVNNTIVSLENGVNYLDSTIMGMGRGAGNAPTEYLILECSKRSEKYNPSAIFPLVLKDFNKLHKKYNWGTSLLYYLSAQFNIHPTYIQEILASNQSTTNILTALENLKSANAISYSKEKLNSAFELDYINSKGTWSPETIFLDKDVLILGSGPSVSHHSTAIESYIKAKKPIVISLNLNKFINSDLIDLYAACHPIKLLSDIKRYKDIKKPVMLPFDSLNENLKEQISSVDVLNYGITISENKFKSEDKTCYLPAPLVFAYTIAAASAGRSNRILVAGLDGYSLGDSRQFEMENILECYTKSNCPLEILSVTPTTYKLRQTTIYNFDL